MQKTILLLLTLILILGVFVSCGYKATGNLDSQTSSSPSEDTTEAREETTEDEDIDIDVETTSEENKSVSAITTAISEDTLNITSDTQGMAEIPPTDTQYSDDYVYYIEKRGDNYYMVFNSYDISRPPNITFSPSPLTVYLEDLKNTIPREMLSDADKKELLISFVNDNSRANGFLIYDIEHVWKPTVPIGWELQNDVEWTLHSYKFIATIGDIEAEEHIEAHITVYLKESYDSFCDSLKPEYTQVIQNGDVVYTVEKRPYTGMYSYQIACSDGEFFSSIQIIGYREITDEELFSFTLKEYVG